MKKSLWIALIFIFVSIFVFSACDSNDKSSIGNDAEDTESEQASNNDGECRHVYGNWITSKQATCKEEGQLIRTCTKCDFEERTNVAKSNVHIEVIDAAVSATCSIAGLTEGKHCSLCNKVLVAQRTTPKVSHNVAYKYGYGATCTSDGLTNGSFCVDCKTVLSKQTVIPKLGHTIVTVQGKKATCNSTGLTDLKYCSVCNTTIQHQQIIEKTNNHTYSTGICSLCGDNTKDFAGGIGTEERPYLIANQTQLEKIGSYSKTHFKLKNDIYLSGAWSAIESFDGTLDGNSFKILNLVSKGTSREGFIIENKGTIKNLGIKNCDVKAEGSFTYGNSKTQAAGICVKNSGTIEYCYVTGKIESYLLVTTNSNINTGTAWAGGIAAENTGVIRYSYNTAKIYAEAEGYSKATPKAFSGGIVGNNNMGRVSNCYNNGVIEAAAFAEERGYSSCGGIAGTHYLYHTIEYCYSSSNIAYRIIGDYSNGLIKNCYTNSQSYDENGNVTYCTNDLTKQETFIGFDFLTEWKFFEGTTPILTKNCSDICENHVWSDWTIRLKATCKEEGINTRNCKKCGLVNNEIIDKIDHIETIDNYVAPSCSQTGLTEGSHCSMCNKTLVEQIVISKTEHEHIVIDAIKNPSCELSGLTEGSHCKDCNAVIVAQVVIPAAGHERYVYEIVNPTCTEYGYTIYKCRNCDYSNNENQIEPNGHNYVIEITRKDPTCIYLGSVTHQCNGCTAKNTKTLLPTQHDFVNDICTKCEQKAPTNGLIYKGYGSNTSPAAVSGIGTATNEAIIVISDISPHSGIYYGQTLVYHPITEIEDNAFENCENIEVVIIPKTVTKIGDYAFSGCTKLKTVITHDNITSIGFNAFSGCSSLTNIVIPDGLTLIKNYTFSGCTSLANIEIPDGVISIGTNAFEGCSSLAYNEYDNAFYLGNKENPYLILMKVKDSFVANCIINEGTKCINGDAFLYCDLLENIIIPNGVETIGNDAFYGCTSLTHITIPNSVIRIGGGAFTDCRNLASIVIPNSVTTIAYCAISGVTRATIYCEAESLPSGWDTYWTNSYNTVVWGYKCNIDGVFYGIKDNAATVLRQTKVVETISIPSSIIFEGLEYPVTKIDDYAFGGCSKLTSIVIPTSVIKIGEYAFNTGGTITIYCEVTEKPSGWSYNWNAYKSVVWGHAHSYTDGECICGLKEK